MIPKLYQKDGTTLIGNLTNCIACLVEEERNGIFEVTLQYPNNETISTYLVYDNIIICDSNDTLKDQKFRIYDTRRMMNNTIEVYARHISFDLAYDHIDSIDITNQSCEYALNTIFRNSQFSTGYKGHSDIVNAQNYKISNCNALEAIAGKQGSIIDTYGTGAEILRDNTDIHVLNRRGNDNKVSIEYAKNLTGFELQENTDDLITRIIPFATYTPEGGTQTRVDGPTCNSQYISNYSHPFIAEIDFSDKFKNNEVPTANKLQTLAEKYFTDNKCDLPKQNWKIEFIPLSKCVGYEGIEDAISLCDTVTIKDTRYNINTKAKVIKTVYDVIRERYDSMELGEPRTTLGDIVNTGSEKGEQGPPGPQGPKGEDGNIGDFPDSLPSKPTLNAKLLGFASIQLDWTYENKPYYWYEVYASKEKNFTPNIFDIVHKGQTSSFLYQAKPGETWYFRVCGINSYDHRGEMSDQIEVVTTLVDNLENYFTTAAIGQAVVGSLTADYMTAFIIKGHWIDAKNLSVTDGNGKRTLDIDSFGNVAIDATNVNIKGDSISSIVDNGVATGINNIKIGGRNLLLNTQFEGAMPGSTSCPNWWFWGTTHIYSSQGTGQYTKPNTIYLSPGDDVGGICQDISSDNILRNTQVTISGEISGEGNTKGYEITFEYYDSDYNKIGNTFIKSSNEGYGYFSKTITTPNINYSTFRLVITHLGSDSDGGYLLKATNLMLELGNKASQWRPASDDMASKSMVTQTANSITSSVEENLTNNYATKSLVTQTANEVRYEFKHQGTANLQYNGGGNTYNHDGWLAYKSWWYHGNSVAGYVVNSEEGSGCVQAPFIYCNSNTKYSVKVHVCPEGNTGGFRLSVKEIHNDDSFHYQTVWGTDNTKGWHTVRATFTTGSDTKGFHIELWSDGRTNTEGQYVTFFSELMVFQGAEYFPDSYVPYIGAINSNTTTINGDGVNVTHSDGTKTNLNSTALNFYKDDSLYAQVNGGLFKFWNGSQWIGYLGHSKWVNSDKRAAGVNSEYGHMSTMASKTSSDANSYQTYVIANGCDQTINSVRYRPGVTLINPHIGTRLYLYTNGYYTDNYPSFIVNNSDGHIILAGDNGVNIGALRGNDYYDAIRVTEIESSPHVQVEMWGNLDMHNWSIVNANISKSVSATSAQTYALRTSTEEESYSDPTSKTITDIYGVQSLTNGDVRWSDKQTYFTSSVEEGIYEAYVEIPWWLAQNIELDYHVNITPVNGFYQYYVSERDTYYFCVRSNKDSMGFTFELVATLLEQNTLNNNASIAGEQYLSSEVDDGEQPDMSIPDSSYKETNNNNDDEEGEVIV